MPGSAIAEFVQIDFTAEASVHPAVLEPSYVYSADVDYGRNHSTYALQEWFEGYDDMPRIFKAYTFRPYSLLGPAYDKYLISGFLLGRSSRQLSSP